MGRPQLAGVLSIVAAGRRAAAGRPFDEDARRRDAGGGRGSRSRRESLPHVPVRDGSTTTASSTRATPAPSSASACPPIHNAPVAGARRLRRLPDVRRTMITAVAASPTAARSPAGSSRTCRGSGIADRRGLLRRRRRRAARRARPTRAVRLPGQRARPTRTCAATCHRGRPARRRRRRPPRLRLPVRERRLRPGRPRRRADLGRPAAGRDRGDGLEDPREGADGGGRRAASWTALDPGTVTAPTCRCWSRPRPGGGGRGMRIVPALADLPAALEGAAGRGGVGVRRRRPCSASRTRATAATSRCRCWPTRTARSGRSASASARSSAATRRSSRRRRRPACQRRRLRERAARRGACDAAARDRLRGRRHGRVPARRPTAASSSWR